MYDINHAIQIIGQQEYDRRVAAARELELTMALQASEAQVAALTDEVKKRDQALARATRKAGTR